MKAKIHVTLKSGILDPQGKAIEHALATLGYQAVRNVRVGKHIELELDDTAVADVESEIQAMCEKLLANTIIEEYSYELGSGGTATPPATTTRPLPIPEREEQEEEHSEPTVIAGDQPARTDTILPPLATETVPTVSQTNEDPTLWASASAKPSQDAKAEEEARRLAKRILADLAALNGKAVDDGVRCGNFRQSLQEDLDEGLRLFRQQVPEAVRAQHDFFGEAVDEFIVERQRKLGMR